MRAKDNEHTPQTADDDAAQHRAEGIHGGVQPLDDVANIDADRAHNHQHHRNHHDQGDAGHQDQLEDFRDYLGQ